MCSPCNGGSDRSHTAARDTNDVKPPGGSNRGCPPFVATSNHVWDLKKEVAEEEGFEPPVALTTLVFKTSAFNRSAIPPTEAGCIPSA